MFLTALGLISLIGSLVLITKSLPFSQVA